MRIFGMIGLLNLIITNEYVIIFKVNVVIPHQSRSRWDIGNGVSVDLDFIFLIFKAFFVEFKSFPFPSNLLVTATIIVSHCIGLTLPVYFAMKLISDGQTLEVKSPKYFHSFLEMLKRIR